MTIKILCVIGTRPEAIKMAPIICALKAIDSINCRVLATAQHRHMLDQVLDVFDIKPDIDLNIMRPNQKLTTLTARLLLDMDDVLLSENPDVVLAQGDTTTVMTIAMACFYCHIPFAHVEAGLRTWDMFNPFPEEMNRVIAGRIARWHFAPTEGSKKNLLKEGVSDKEIFVTGNTVIDALKFATQKYQKVGVELDETKRLILVTVHRRENFGNPIKEICRALITLVENNDDVQVLIPVHHNPNVKAVLYEMLSDKYPQIILSPPLDYLPFIGAMQKAYLILSDSGGIQEEAPALGKPVLVLRNETERPEAVEAGAVKLVGSDCKKIVKEVQYLLDDYSAYQGMVQQISPYGDGQASQRIIDALKENLNF
jgi:UDP-N-acetylglucosamine 2-epimerase (non-hydrolysing)